MLNWFFKSLLILFFLINSSCQGINYYNLQERNHHGYEEGEIIIASLDDYKIYHHQDEISGVVIDEKEQEEESGKKWIWVVVTLVAVAGVIASIAIIDDNNGDGSKEVNGNGEDVDEVVDDVIDMDVAF